MGRSANNSADGAGYGGFANHRANCKRRHTSAQTIDFAASD
jgi:hypothetical protein